MTLDPLFAAPLAVQIHIIAAAFAITLGPIALYRRKRDRVHRVTGRIWVGVMAVLAITGFFIPAAVLPLVGMFGPIHLFSVWAIFSLTRGLRAILRRDVARHSSEMRALYWQALGIAGLLTLLPGRRLNAVLFGEAELLGIWVIAGSALATIAFLLLRARQRPA